MFKLKKNNITLDQQYETRSEAETAILDQITAEAKIISDASVAIKNTNNGWDLFVNGKVRWFYQIFEVHADAVTDSCWYEERWYDSDLENALLYHEVPVTEKTMALMKENCEHLFDDKSARNEMLADVAYKIKESIQENESPLYMMVITEETDAYPSKSLSDFAARPWEGTYVKTLFGNAVEDFFEESDIEGLFYQLIDNRKGTRISYGSVDVDRLTEEISEYESLNN